MKKYKLPNTDLEVSELALGTMRIASKPIDEVVDVLKSALELGINFLDEADIYMDWNTFTPSETVIGEAFAKCPGLREKFVVQTKCGICRGFYDSSYEHIVEAVNQSLERLQTNYIDILLIHRPDALVEPEEVAKAFNELHAAGKVKYFGVSNMNASQIALLNKYLDQKIITNQLQFSITASNMIDVGLNVNMDNALSVDHDGDVLNYCRLNDITLQAWSPLQINLFDGSFIGSDRFPKLNELLTELAKKYNVTEHAIAIAWILRHPAHIIPVLGTTSIKHIEEIAKATEITLTKPEWYDLYKSVGKELA